MGVVGWAMADASQAGPALEVGHSPERLDADREAEQIGRARVSRSLDRGAVLDQALDPLSVSCAARLEPRGGGDRRRFAARDPDREHAAEACGDLARSDGVAPMLGTPG